MLGRAGLHGQRSGRRKFVITGAPSFRVFCERVGSLGPGAPFRLLLRGGVLAPPPVRRTKQFLAQHGSAGKRVPRRKSPVGDDRMFCRRFFTPFMTRDGPGPPFRLPLPGWGFAGVAETRAPSGAADLSPALQRWVAERNDPESRRDGIIAPPVLHHLPARGGTCNRAHGHQKMKYPSGLTT